MLMVAACLSLIFAPLTMKLELALPASMDTTLLTVSVNSLHSTTLNPLMLVVPSGTGLTRSVSNAQLNGPSMLMVSACPFPTFVPLMMPQVPAPHASRDTILKKESVFSQLLTP